MGLIQSADTNFDELANPLSNSYLNNEPVLDIMSQPFPQPLDGLTLATTETNSFSHGPIAWAGYQPSISGLVLGQQLWTPTTPSLMSALGTLSI